MNLKQSLALIDIQARLSLKSEASKLYLSYFWWVLEPLLFVAVYYVVFQFLLARGNDQFVLFLMCGKVPYLWLSKSITYASNSLLMNKGLIAATSTPKIIFPLSAIQEVTYKQWVVFVVLLLMTLGFGHKPDHTWLWLIPLIAATFLLTVTLSLIGAILVTLMQDLRIVINMGLIFLLFSSGVFWDINQIQDEFWRNFVLTANPLAFLIDCYRLILMENTLYDPTRLSWLVLALGSVSLITLRSYSTLNALLTRKVLES